MTIEDIIQLIKADESRTLEVKKSTGELKDAMHTACAFLNTDGGWLIFGITPILVIKSAKSICPVCSKSYSPIYDRDQAQKDRVPFKLMRDGEIDPILIDLDHQKVFDDQENRDHCPINIGKDIPYHFIGFCMGTKVKSELRADKYGDRRDQDRDRIQ